MQKKKIRVADLGKLIGTSGDIFGRYERGKKNPSSDVVATIANALGVTLDYLVKDGEYEHIDNERLKKLKEIQNLDPENKSQGFATINTFIKAAKLKNIASL